MSEKINFINKMFAGVCFHVGGRKKPPTGFKRHYFFAKIFFSMLLMAVLLNILFLYEYFFDKNIALAHKMIRTITDQPRTIGILVEFMIALLFFPLWRMVILPREEILKFIEETDKKELVQYYWYYVITFVFFIIIIPVLLFYEP